MYWNVRQNWQIVLFCQFLVRIRLEPVFCQKETMGFCSSYQSILSRNISLSVETWIQLQKETGTRRSEQVNMVGFLLTNLLFLSTNWERIWWNICTMEFPIKKQMLHLKHILCKKGHMLNILLGINHYATLVFVYYTTITRISF